MGALGAPFPYFVAPMVGLSNTAFREWIRGYCPTWLDPILFTEMVSTRRIPSQNMRHSSWLQRAHDERNFVPQLLGNEERFIAPSIEKLSLQSPWGFDINMGCPVKHTLRHNWGVRLMGDRTYAAEVVRITRKHTKLPLSVKLRGGSDDELNEQYLDDFTSALEDAGADWLTIHARPRAARHKGTADWTLVARMASKRGIPVVANGDIQTADDAIHVVTDLRTDGAMIARAATVRPWILSQIAHQLNLGPVDAPLLQGRPLPLSPEDEGREYGFALLSLLHFMETFIEGEKNQLQAFLFLCVTAAPWFTFGHSFCRHVRTCKTTAALRDMLVRHQNLHGFEMRQRLQH